MLIFYVSFQIIFELLKVIFLLKLKLSQKLSFIHTLIKNSGFGLYKKNSRHDFMLYMLIYPRFIVIGKNLEDKFIAGKLLAFIGSKFNKKNITKMLKIDLKFGFLGKKLDYKRKKIGTDIIL